MIVQSHWSKPTRWLAQNKNPADLLFMYASSAESLRRAFGMPVGMVTDSEFASTLSGLPMPYDFITTELDGWDLDPRWWASPKFHIFKRYAPQARRFFQMDTDVFFWEPMAVGDHVGLLVQSVESGDQFSTSYEQPVEFFQKTFAGMGLTREDTRPWRPDLTTALNCGVVGFAKADDAVEYATMAERMCRVMTPALDDFNALIPASRRMGTAMVVPEQYFLQCFADARNLYTAHVCMKTVRGVPAYFDPDDYFHAMAQKCDPKVRDRFRGMVAERQPALHRDILARYRDF